MFSLFCCMTKAELLAQLSQETFVTLRPSPVEGIGVFAIVDIPKGTKNIFSAGVGAFIPVHKSEIETLPQHAKDLIANFCLYDADNYYVPDYGFKLMDVSVYLNHSETPNVVSVNEGEYFEAIVDIKKGEELLVDYGTLVEDEEE
jgi:SET domain-containing protein